MKCLTITNISLIMRTIRKKKKKILTNYYMTYNQSDKIFDVIESEETVVFAIQEGVIYRIFYYSCDENDLIECLSQIDRACVLDIISKEEEMGYAWLEKANFEFYSKYIRFGSVLPTYEEQVLTMKNNRLDSFYNEEYGEYAQEEDVAEIQKLISAAFDAKTDHLFSDEELLNRIKKHQVLVDRDQGAIYCMLIFDITGKQFYYNLVYNEGTADVSYSMEKKALLYAIKEHGVNYAYSWIDIRNKKALKRNTAKPDGVYNYIFKRKEE